MQVFPFVFSHALKPVDPCFEDNYESSLSDFVEKLGDRAFEALLIRNVIFGEFLLAITKKEEITRCEVWVVTWVRYRWIFSA
jgi:hypothetical protein